MKLLSVSAALFCLSIFSASFLLFNSPRHSFAQTAYAKPALGVNVGTDPQLFTDAMKSARQVWDAAGGGNCTQDANGWPTEDCGVYVWEGQANNDGTYKLIFNGQATVDVSLGYATVSNQQYNASTNTTTATLVVTDTGAENFHLNFTNSKRTASSATNTGVTNVQLFKPTSEGSSTSFDATQIFTPWFKQAVAPYNYMRFMAGTNWNKSTNWSDRTTVNYSTQHKVLPGESGFEGNLMAFEYMVELCNETGKDFYVNVPDRATDDYVTKLAQLIVYGSDGVNPYTSPQSNPVWKPLNSNLNVYIEYTNEAWNFIFDQAHDISDNATAEVQSNPNSPLSYDGNTNADVIRFRYYARRSLQISALFRQVVGDSAMLTRFRPVIEWQYSNLNGTAENALEFLNNYYNNADGVQHVSNPHPVAYYFWGGGGAVYYNSNNDSASTVDGIYASGIPSDGYTDTLAVESLWAHAYGLHFMAYEGGFAVGGDGASGAAAASRWDPRAKQTMIDSFNDFAAAGGDAYTAGTYGQWNNILQASSAPLVQAAAQITSSSFTPSPISRGQVIDGSNPTIIAGPHYDIARNWPQGPGSNLGKDSDYMLRVDNAGTYQFALNVSNSAAGGKINVYVDGTQLQTVSVPNGTQSVVAGSVSLAVGLHGLILRPSANASNGTAGTINAVIVQPGTGTPAGVPTPGALPSGWQSQDIGSVGQAGSASYNNGTYSIISSGGDISNTTDQFHFVYQTVSGNGSAVARVTFEGDANDYAKAGVMIRETTDGGSTHASTLLFAVGGSVINDRTTTGGNTSQAGPLNGYPPTWVKIERSGTTFTSSVSKDGQNWKQIGTATISMANTVDVGLAFDSHDNALLAAADFDNVSISGFSGVQSTPTPGSTPTATPTSTPTSGSWTFCANEGGTCTFSGTQQVRYGANGTYAYQTATGSIGCNNSVFGDPLPGVVKHCDVSSGSNSTPTPTPGSTPTPTSTPTSGSWTFCANEGGTCTFSGTQQVRYGANGTYAYQTATGSIGCNNSVFGDPLPNVVKHCDVSSGGSSTPTPTPTPTSTTTYLSDLNWTSATTGYGSVQKDKSVNGNSITLRGTVYPKGIGTHAISEIHYALGGSYKTFVADVGIDDESGTAGSVVFQVYADGVKVFDSGVVHGGDAVQHINVSVSGVSNLELYVGDAGDGINSDHADWAGARLLS